KPKYTNCHSL
ncbi:rhs family domain protein, partial [Vibrio parahaemolyticus AQ3810]